MSPDERKNDDRLAEYRGRRDAKRTPEPVPEEKALPHGDDDTFVVQEHHASSLHWDLKHGCRTP